MYQYMYRFTDRCNGGSAGELNRINRNIHERERERRLNFHFLKLLLNRSPRY